MIPDITNPFSPEVARGIEDQANEAGYSIFLCNTNWEDSREIRSLRVLTEKRVDGIIIAPTSNRLDFLEEILPRGIPVVFVSSAAKNSEHSSVVIELLYNPLDYYRIPLEIISWGGERDQSKESEEVKQAIKDFDWPETRRVSAFGRGFWKEH